MGGQIVSQIQLFSTVQFYTILWQSKSCNAKRILAQSAVTFDTGSNKWH